MRKIKDKTVKWEKTKIAHKSRSLFSKTKNQFVSLSSLLSSLRQGPLTVYGPWWQMYKTLKPENNCGIKEAPEVTSGSLWYWSGCSTKKCWEKDSEFGQRIADEGLVNNSLGHLIPGCNAGLPVKRRVIHEQHRASFCMFIIELL